MLKLDLSSWGHRLKAVARKRYLLILLCALLLGALGVSAMKSGGALPGEASPKVMATVQFARKGGGLNATALQGEPRSIPVDPHVENGGVVENLVRLMGQNPPEKGLLSVVHKDTFVQWSFYSDGWLGVSFNQNISGNEQEDSAQEILARYAVVLSLSSLELPSGEKISDVSFYVDGVLQSVGKGESGVMTVGDVVDNIAEKPVKYTAKLYFPRDGVLLGENRVISTRSNQSVEYYILQELLSGSSEKDRANPFPPGMTILKTNTEYGTCYVNVSKDFIGVFDETDEAAKLCVYSIVNSLTELDTVRAVKFLVEGQAVGTIGAFDLSSHFTRDTKLIGSVK